MWSVLTSVGWVGSAVDRGRDIKLKLLTTSEINYRVVLEWNNVCDM